MRPAATLSGWRDAFLAAGEASLASRPAEGEELESEPLKARRWVDAPAAFGPRETLYNRSVRWAAKGVRERVFRALAASGGPPAELLLDSSHVKAHRSAGGGKGPTSRGLCCFFVKAHRSAGGGKGGSARRPSGGHATHRGRPRWGPPRGGRTSKIHTLTDHLGRPIGFELTAAQRGDAPVALALLAPWPSARLRTH